MAWMLEYLAGRAVLYTVASVVLVIAIQEVYESQPSSGTAFPVTGTSTCARLQPGMAPSANPGDAGELLAESPSPR